MRAIKTYALSFVPTQVVEMRESAEFASARFEDGVIKLVTLQAKRNDLQDHEFVIIEGDGQLSNGQRHVFSFCSCGSEYHLVVGYLKKRDEQRNQYRRRESV